MHLLHVIADPMPPAEALEKRLATAALEALRTASPRAVVTEVDLYADPPPFFDYALYRYLWYPLGKDYEPSPEEVAASAYLRRHAELFRKADIVVLTAPMWNASVPAILKAWIDQLLAPNELYRFGGNGPEAMHHVRKIVVFTTSGSVYSPGDPRDCLSTLVRAAFAFVKIDDVEIVWADGQNRAVYADADERSDRAMADAVALGKRLAAEG